MPYSAVIQPRPVSRSHDGTRCSTVLLVGRNGDVTFVERSFDHRTGHVTDAVYDFSLSPATDARRSGSK